MEWLRSFLTLSNGVPSHDVFRNVLMALQPAALIGILQRWCGELGGKHIAIDGQALRGTYDGEAGKCLVHIMRAWACEAGISAGQAACREKSNELEALVEETHHLTTPVEKLAQIIRGHFFGGKPAPPSAGCDLWGGSLPGA